MKAFDGVDTLKKSLQDNVDTLEKMNWKVSVGLEAWRMTGRAIWIMWSLY